MAWELIEDIDKFTETAGGFLRSRPVENTVLLTLIDTLRRRGLHVYGTEDPIFGCWRTQEGFVSGVLLQTPPHPMCFSPLPPGAVPAAAEVLAGRPLSGVNLLADDAEAFIARWPAPATVRMRTRLYRLDALTPPATTPPGAARTAGPGDRALVLRWMTEFHDYLGEHNDALGDLVDARIEYGGVTLWAVDNVPVSMAVRSRPTAGMIRIQTVYTPPGLRGRGYAAAATTASTRAALDDGATEVVLNTDLANPTSNALYQRLGYRPIEDRTVVEFAS